MPRSFADADTPSTGLHVLTPQRLADWRKGRSAEVSAWLDRIGFTGALGQTAVVPDGAGALAVAGYGTAEQRARGRFHLADAARTLPAGAYHLETDLPESELEETALGWLLAAYSRGIFPWYSEGDPILWWCPDPRIVFHTNAIHLSRRFRRRRRGDRAAL